MADVVAEETFCLPQQAPDDELSDLDSHSRLHTSRRSWATLQLLWLANAILLCICALLGTIVIHNDRPAQILTQRPQITDPYSPANEAITYEYRQIKINDTYFRGVPGHEWETAMHELMSGTLIRISEDERRKHGSESIPLKDGGYAAGLGVAHNLHCVKKLKKFIYREHAYPDLSPTSKDFEHLQLHADHCLDYLRQSIMCQVDYSLYTLYWGNEQQIRPIHRIPESQKCVNWNELHDWMKGRQANEDMLTA